LIEIEKKVEDSKFEYTALENGENIAGLKGSFINPKNLRLWRYDVFNKDKETQVFEALQKRFYSDCLEMECRIVVELFPSTESAKYFMDESEFIQSSVNYVFEDDLQNLITPSKAFHLMPFSEVDLAEYQKIYFESSKGDPQFDLEGISAKEYFNIEKEELGELYNESLMHTVSFENEVIGVLNLRIMPHPKTKEKEGAINYLGLLPNKRKKGHGQILHQTGLQKLKSLGCKSYYGGTNNANLAMLKIFNKNKCVRAEEQYTYILGK